MREIATDTIKAAAERAGINPAHVTLAVAVDNITLPRKRVEITCLEEQYTRSGRPLRKRPTEGRAKTHRTLTRAQYTVKLTVRVSITSDDVAWLRQFSDNFVAALPKVITDPNGNTVTINVQKAEYGGFTRQAVEVFVKRTKTYHVLFAGVVSKDTDIPLIADVHINPKYREAG